MIYYFNNKTIIVLLLFIQIVCRCEPINTCSMLQRQPQDSVLMPGLLWWVSLGFANSVAKRPSVL